MIAGFSIETKPLTDLEKKMLPKIVKGLSTMHGSANAISNKEIAEKIFDKYEIQLSDARIRKIINHIRMHNLLPGLVANGCGYYITSNINELIEYYKSLEGRESAIHAIKLKVKEHIVLLEQRQQQSFNYK
jgi:uncharacterized cysteine cluster protein YcgN (CxxCxxCC family)